MRRKTVLKRTDPRFLNGICHRGLHDDVAPENSIAAFKKAIEADFAFECDVHLTKDNEIVIMHDSNLERLTGKAGVIEELTLEEIKNNYTLKDGSTVPTLKEVLELNNEQVPICIELKVVKSNFKPLAKRVKQILKEYVKDRKKYFLISFDPRSLWPLKSLRIINGLLVGYDEPWTIKLRRTCNSLDLDFKKSLEEIPMKYFKHHFINVWTIETKEDFELVKDHVDTVTFQHLDPLWIKEELNNRNR